MKIFHIALFFCFTNLMNLFIFSKEKLSTRLHLASVIFFSTISRLCLKKLSGLGLE